MDRTQALIVRAQQGDKAASEQKKKKKRIG